MSERPATGSQTKPSDAACTPYQRTRCWRGFRVGVAAGPFCHVDSA